MGKKHQLYEIWTVGKKVRVMLSTGIKEVTEKSATFYIQDDKRLIEEKKKQLHLSHVADYADALAERIISNRDNFAVEVSGVEGVENRYFKNDMEVTYGNSKDSYTTSFNLTLSDAKKMIQALTEFVDENQNLEPLENHVYELAENFCERGI